MTATELVDAMQMFKKTIRSVMTLDDDEKQYSSAVVKDNETASKKVCDIYCRENVCPLIFIYLFAEISAFGIRRLPFGRNKQNGRYDFTMVAY
jgi:hypothetical protein